MNKRPTISIIIPIYKVEKYLKLCLDSIANQTFDDFEVLMIDDGSPDNSGEICVNYQHKDSRFRYYHKPNGGAASARNYALNLARGDYFAFIDSDDSIDSKYLEYLYAQIRKYGSDIAIISYLVKDENNNYFVPMDPNGKDTRFNHVFTPEEWVHEFFNRDGMIYTAPWSKLFSRHTFHNLYFPEDVEAGDDQFTIWRAYMNANVISFDNKQDYCYVTNSSSLSHVYFAS